MSGHSKWATIKRKKGKLDAERGKIFTKLIKEITIAARDGGGDPMGNPRLRTAVAAGKAANMPAANIERAIKKGTGELPGQRYEEYTYEGYGPHGVAIFLEVLSDNKNRTTSELRHVLSKAGGSMGEGGCVAWMFDQKGLITIDKAQAPEDKMLDLALEIGAEDVATEDPDVYEVYTAPTDLNMVLKGLEAAGITSQSAELMREAKTTVALDEKGAEQIMKLMDTLEDHDDVQKVWANFDIPAEVMEKLQG
ncbi:MAG: YebC/PmpR family DNA-binding transcriptional regulator [Candidatus Eisenbacteria bacterium]|nr:YebC/PmpR family DNA-binding transcriptional regulator [Candidatus Eisenbacteria bacterium]MCC7143004.1 YebC/PmpR family DNA-binding transcriptional regulator [Candidatus Eisenbacteria bacterium]